MHAATQALWLQAQGAAADAVAAPEPLAGLRAAVSQALAGDLDERLFPRRPLLMPRLIAATRDPRVAARALVDIIVQDPVLAGNVLRIANSAWYRFAHGPVDSLHRAVMMFGADGLQALAAMALLQPVFRSESGAFDRLAAVLWERTTRAALAAEIHARETCPGSTEHVQLLVLLRALGPLVVLRALDDCWRRQPQLPHDAACCAVLLVQQGGGAAARCAARWDSPAGVRQVLDELAAGDRGETPVDPPTAVERSVARSVADSVEIGELLAATSLLLAAPDRDAAAVRRLADASGLPPERIEATLARLGGAV